MKMEKIKIIALMIIETQIKIVTSNNRSRDAEKDRNVLPCKVQITLKRIKIILVCFL